jgi:hypothetical protein
MAFSRMLGTSVKKRHPPAPLTPSGALTLFSAPEEVRASHKIGKGKNFYRDVCAATRRTHPYNPIFETPIKGLGYPIAFLENPMFYSTAARVKKTYLWVGGGYVKLF